MEIPFCTIIVLNYFGEDVIENNINSLLQLDYPKDRYEIIIVDNASGDKSRTLISKFSKKYSRIKTIFLDQNLGFSGGNNVGLRSAKGEYVALLNNDCVVHKSWLRELVKTAQGDDKIFAVNSRILRYPRYFKLKLKIPAFLLIEECSVLKSALSSRELGDKIPISGDYREEYYLFEVPFDELKDREIYLSVIFNDKIKNMDHIKVQNLPLGSYKISRSKMQDSNFTVILEIDLRNPFLRKQSYDFIQNAGIMVFQDGYGRDIGAVVQNHKQSYEPDFGQYNNSREVYAACAAAVLYRRKILDQIGDLDETFFMYYEDVEISERARFFGYKSFYCPNAKVRHYHSLTSKEWSPKFVYNSEKGRLLHIFYNFPINIFFKEYGKFVVDFFIAFCNIAISLKRTKKILKLLLLKKEDESEQFDSNRVINTLQCLKVLINFGLSIPILLYKRNQRFSSIPKNSVRQNYRVILGGRWYFK